MENNNHAGIQISKKAFFSSVIILFCLMMAAGILTYIIPGGAFEKTVIDGKESIIPGTFQFTDDGGYPIWRWFTAPFEVFVSSDAVTVISIILFILSGVLNAELVRFSTAIRILNFLQYSSRLL